jgi:hypothetical protein
VEWWLWLVIAVAVLLPLGLLGLAAGALRRRLAELNRVAALATEQGQAELAGINRRSAQLQERLATIRNQRPTRA